MCKEQYAKIIDKTVFPGIQGGPLMHVIAAKAVALKEALRPEFKKYQKQIVRNARVLAYEFNKKGYRVVAGGTDTHLLLIDLRNKQVTGLEAEKTLEKAGITVNKNSIPYDPLKPFVTSGIRLGSPTLTSRGMKEKEMRKIVRMIDEVISHRNDEKHINKIGKEVTAFCKKFPLYTKRLKGQ